MTRATGKAEAAAVMSFDRSQSLGCAAERDSNDSLPCLDE
jgi:hypothetical protein